MKRQELDFGCSRVKGMRQDGEAEVGGMEREEKIGGRNKNCNI